MTEEPFFVEINLQRPTAVFQKVQLVSCGVAPEEASNSRHGGDKFWPSRKEKARRTVVVHQRTTEPAVEGQQITTTGPRRTTRWNRREAAACHGRAERLQQCESERSAATLVGVARSTLRVLSVSVPDHDGDVLAWLLSISLWRTSHAQVEESDSASLPVPS